MKSKYLLSATILLVQLIAAPFSARAIPHKNITISDETEPTPFDLYFTENTLVEVSSRYPKALPRVAENITTITAAEIQAAKVHTLAEILNRVSGVFVSFNGQDFGGSTSILIQGTSSAHTHHTLVLLDGVKYNYISNGAAETNDIPVAIIKRIEIVKGPASSTWGSALGGVINIITKDSGKNSRPSGEISTSVGEADSSDLRGETSGGAQNLRYYLYAGKQKSNGLRDNRFFKNENFYGKLRITLPHQSEFFISGGSTRPELRYFDYAPIDLRAEGGSRNHFLTANFHSTLTHSVNLALSVNTASRKYRQDYTFLSTKMFSQRYQWDEDSSSVEGRIVWDGENQFVVVGLDYGRNKLDQRIGMGLYWQGMGLPSEVTANPAAEERWAAYINDTVEMDKITITPGLRYDRHSITSDFLSPSLGAVYKYRDDVLFRGSVARGFSSPYLSLISGGGNMFMTINPELKPEQVWSWQLGLETAAFQFCRIKTTLFFHDLHDAWERDPSAGDKIVNGGNNKRSGYEIELETIPFHHVSLSTNITSVYKRTFTAEEDDHFYNVNTVLGFDHPEFFRAELFGHYVWWPAEQNMNGKYDNFLWDFTLAKQISLQRFDAELFLAVHNLFNSSQYWGDLGVNPDRWIDSGITISF